MIEAPSDQTVLAAVAILGAKLPDDEEDLRFCELTSDPVLRMRLICFIPEAFAVVFAAHLPGGQTISFPKTFSAMTNAGKWRSIPLASEPIFSQAVELASEMVHGGPRNVFENVLYRSALVGCLNKALEEGSDIDHSSLAIAVSDIPAETYPKRRRWFHVFSFAA